MVLRRRLIGSAHARRPCLDLVEADSLLVANEVVLGPLFLFCVQRPQKISSFNSARRLEKEKKKSGGKWQRQRQRGVVFTYYKTGGAIGLYEKEKHKACASTARWFVWRGRPFGRNAAPRGGRGRAGGRASGVSLSKRKKKRNGKIELAALPPPISLSARERGGGAAGGER